MAASLIVHCRHDCQAACVQFREAAPIGYDEIDEVAVGRPLVPFE